MNAENLEAVGLQIFPVTMFLEKLIKLQVKQCCWNLIKIKCGDKKKHEVGLLNRI